HELRSPVRPRRGGGSRSRRARGGRRRRRGSVGRRLVDQSEGAAKATSTWRRSSRAARSEEHTSELQSLTNLVCRLLLAKKKIESDGPVGRFEGRSWRRTSVRTRG